MPIAAACVWELRTTGASTNGGGYVSGGTDYSQQDTAQLALTDVVAIGTTTLTSATAGFTSAMVGNIIYLQGGTGSLAATRRQITAFTNASTITVSDAVAAGTGITGNVGGALLQFANASLSMVAGNVVYVKAGTYNITAATSMLTNTSSGTFTQSTFVGYNTNRNLWNLDTKPLLTTATNSVPLLTGNNSLNVVFRNISFSSTAGTKTTMLTSATGGSSAFFYECRFEGFQAVTPTSTSAANQYGGYFVRCEFYNMTVAGIQRGNSSNLDAYYCYFDNCVAGMKHDSTAGILTAIGCVFDSNTTAGIDVARTTTSQAQVNIKDCTFYGNGEGIYFRGNLNITPQSIELDNNVFYGNTRGIRVLNAITVNNAKFLTYRTNAFGNNASGNHTNFPTGYDEITLTADPFTNAAGGDFTYNNTAGGGALLRGTGSTGYTYGNTTNHKDVGAVQHLDSGGGGTNYTGFLSI